MAKIYDSIMPLIKPGRIATAAATLGETEQKVSAGVDIILPSLLARALKIGDTTEMREVIQEAGKMKLWSDYNQIWEGSGVIDGKNMGERMENRLIGSQNTSFRAAVASKTGLKKESADRLSNWVSATIAAWFGEKVAGGKSYASILEDLRAEKEELRKDIPSNIINDLGLGTVLGAAAANKPASGAAATQPKKKRNWNWLMWLALIILILLIFFWWRSCDRKKKMEEATVMTEQVVTTPQQPARQQAQMPKEIKRTLSGQAVTFYEDANADYIKAYLDSDKFKNANDAQLKTVWFEFADIDFEHNSATELQGNGDRRVRNLADILKDYPNVKVKVGAFADKTGTRATNFSISEKRAANIKMAFEKAGVDAKRISTEGFGEGYATVSESATDAQRSPDRDIALRFTK